MCLDAPTGYIRTGFLFLSFATLPPACSMVCVWKRVSGSHRPPCLDRVRSLGMLLSTRLASQPLCPRRCSALVDTVSLFLLSLLAKRGNDGKDNNHRFFFFHQFQSALSHTRFIASQALSLPLRHSQHLPTKAVKKSSLTGPRACCHLYPSRQHIVVFFFPYHRTGSHLAVPR